MLPKPQSRLELLYEKIALGVSDNLPIPQSRMELLVKAFITGDIDNLPIPQSRSEMLLHAILKNEECNLNAQSRVELFLKAILNVDIENLPTPLSRVEVFLDHIARNGCLEKYEYYPFAFANHLNVKNTTNAKMKIRSIKGKTLIVDANSNEVVAGTEGARLLSVGQDNGNKIEVLSTNENIISDKLALEYGDFSMITGDISLSGDKSKCRCVNYIPVQPNTMYYLKFNSEIFDDYNAKVILFYDSNKQFISKHNESYQSPSNARYIKFRTRRIDNKIITIEELNNLKVSLCSSSEYVPYQSNKKEILLPHCHRGINDSICDEIVYLDETDSNATKGRGLYHIKRCEERKYQVGDESNSTVITDMINTVYQLNSPIVTKFDDINDLYSYENETNIFVNGGAIPVMATVEVGTKIGTIVSQLRKEVKEIDEKQSQHMKYVLNGDMRAIAEDLYPNDFIENQEL